MADGLDEGTGTKPDAASDLDLARRQALVRMGKFAGLTAPVVVTLLTTDSSTAWAGSKPDKPKPKPK